LSRSPTTSLYGVPPTSAGSDASRLSDPRQNAVAHVRESRNCRRCGDPATSGTIQARGETRNHEEGFRRVTIRDPRLANGAVATLDGSKQVPTRESCRISEVSAAQGHGSSLDCMWSSHDGNTAGAGTSLETRATVKQCDWCNKRLRREYKLRTCPGCIEQLKKPVLA